jgi:hypothetical protein
MREEKEEGKKDGRTVFEFSGVLAHLGMNEGDYLIRARFICPGAIRRSAGKAAIA